MVSLFFLNLNYYAIGDFHNKPARCLRCYLFDSRSPNTHTGTEVTTLGFVSVICWLGGGAVLNVKRRGENPSASSHFSAEAVFSISTVVNFVFLSIVNTVIRLKEFTDVKQKASNTSSWFQAGDRNLVVSVVTKPSAKTAIIRQLKDYEILIYVYFSIMITGTFSILFSRAQYQ